MNLLRSLLSLALPLSLISSVWGRQALPVTAACAETTVSTDERVRSIVAADVDNDGDLDFLTSSCELTHVVWHENLVGDGSAFAARAIAEGPQKSRSVTAADLDGDGDPDALAVVGTDLFGEGDLVWFENEDGDGLSWTERPVATGLFSYRNAVGADLDGDGDLDVLAGGHSSNGVHLHENTAGDGTVWSSSLVSASGGLDVAAGDVDGDGDLDALSSSIAGPSVAWHENLVGDASSWSTSAVESGAFNCEFVDFGDVDGDGDLDVLATLVSFSSSDQLAWYENAAGDGSTWSAHTMTTAVDFPNWLAPVDFDGDGDLDVVASEWEGSRISWHENTSGDGSAWADHDIADTPWNTSVCAADVDGDGDPDAASTSWDIPDSFRASWYENVASGSAETLFPSCGLGGTLALEGAIAPGGDVVFTLTGADPIATDGRLAFNIGDGFLPSGDCTWMIWHPSPGLRIPTSPVGGEDAVALTLPCAPSLAGAAFNAQWLVFPTLGSPWAPFPNGSLSNVIRFVVGS